LCEEKSEESSFLLMKGSPVKARWRDDPIDEKYFDILDIANSL